MKPSSDINAGKARPLGVALREWRSLRRVKQIHAAELLNVSQATLSRWESGAKEPDARERDAIVRLLSSRLESAGDTGLARLVTGAAAPVHLVCDLSHKLLACSKSREREFRTSKSELLGRSLWPFATEEIAAAEASLGNGGWFGPAPAPIELETSAKLGQAVEIPESRIRWTRMRLSNGDFVRLVETLPN